MLDLKDLEKALKEVKFKILDLKDISFFKGEDEFEYNLEKFLNNKKLSVNKKLRILITVYQIQIFDKAYLADDNKWAKAMANKISNILFLHIDIVNYYQFYNEINNYLLKLLMSELNPIETINKTILENNEEADYSKVNEETIRILKNNILVRCDYLGLKEKIIEENINAFYENSNFNIDEKGIILSLIYKIIVMYYAFDSEKEKEDSINYICGVNLKKLDRENLDKYLETTKNVLLSLKNNLLIRTKNDEDLLKIRNIFKKVEKRK